MYGRRFGCQLRFAVIVALAVSAGCRADFRVGSQGGQGEIMPFASAGTGSSYLVGTTITLDGTGSFSPDSTIASYHWDVTQRPPFSTGALSAPDASRSDFVLDVPGTYIFELTIRDALGVAATANVTYLAEPPAITIDPGAHQSVAWRQSVQLSGAYQVEAGFPATIQWSFVSRPDKSSAVLTGDTTLSPTFFADAEGDYVVKLTVRTQFVTASEQVTVTSTAPRQILDYALVDARYSTALDRFVIVSDSPPALRLYDPATETDQVVPLAATPKAVAIDPSGLRAAVGHDRMVSVVDLQTRTVTATYAVPIDVYDLAFGGDGRIHCIPDVPTFGSMYTIDTGTGTATDDGYRSAWGRSHPSVHPGGLRMYLWFGDVDWLTRYDISSTPVTRVSLWSDRPVGGELWFIRGGAAFVGSSGAVFSSTDDPSTDATYQATLPETSDPAIEYPVMRWAQDASAAGLLATASTADVTPFSYTDALLTIYDDQTLALRDAIRMPDTPYGGMVYKNKARLVAFRADASKIYVLTDAGPVHAIYPVDP